MGYIPERIGQPLGRTFDTIMYMHSKLYSVNYGIQCSGHLSVRYSVHRSVKYSIHRSVKYSVQVSVHYIIQ